MPYLALGDPPTRRNSDVNALLNSLKWLKTCICS